MEQQPSVEIFGVMVQEPVTTVTDLLVTAVCFWCCFRLSRTKERPLYFHLYFWFLLVMGIATLYGGLAGHAFQYYLGFSWKLPGWIISMLSVGLAERAAIMHARNEIKPGIGTFFAWINIIEVLALLAIVIITKNFFFVEAHAAYGLLLVVFSFEFYYYMRTKDKGSRIIMYAVGAGAIAALVHLTEFAPHKWFNHLDLSHCIMAISAWLFYRGVIAFGEQKTDPPIN